MRNWISIRNRWPEIEGIYRVKDCRHNIEGETFYDGYDFERWEPKIKPMKGALILIEYTTTHWMKLSKE